MPDGFRRMPGPSLILAARYYDSPVGPFLTFVVAHPARVRGNLGWHASTVATDSLGAHMGLRLNWGVPAERADLAWFDRDDGLELRWDQRSLSVTADIGRIPLPILFPARALQRRSDGPVLVPGVARGLAKFSRVSMHAYPGDELAPLAGPHGGLVVRGLRYVVKPAQGPAGVFSTLAISQRAQGGALGFADVSQRVTGPPADRHELVAHRGD